MSRVGRAEEFVAAQLQTQHPGTCARDFSSSEILNVVAAALEAPVAKDGGEEDIEASVARVRERFTLSPAYFDLGDGERQAVDWDSVIGQVLYYAALPRADKPTTPEGA